MNNTTENIENTEKLIDFIGMKYQNGDIDNSTLVQIIELANSYLNLTTISNYAKETGKSYNGVKNHTKVDIKINGIKFIINNK